VPGVRGWYIAVMHSKTLHSCALAVLFALFLLLGGGAGACVFLSKSEPQLSYKFNTHTAVQLTMHGELNLEKLRHNADPGLATGHDHTNLVEWLYKADVERSQRRYRELSFVFFIAWLGVIVCAALVWTGMRSMDASPAPLGRPSPETGDPGVSKTPRPG
jgi:hypothetical protein